jgi:hypothetical protein
VGPRSVRLAAGSRTAAAPGPGSWVKTGAAPSDAGRISHFAVIRTQRLVPVFGIVGQARRIAPRMTHDQDLGPLKRGEMSRLPVRFARSGAAAPHLTHNPGCRPNPPAPTSRPVQDPPRDSQGGQANPRVKIRGPYESHATALDRNEFGALLVAASLGPPAEHALISLLALNGLRVSEATGADIEHLGLERGHRTLVVTRKAAKSSPSRSHPGPRGRSTWRSASAPMARSSSPATAGGRTGTAPPGSSVASPAAPGLPSTSARTRCGTPSSPPDSAPGCRCATYRRQHPTPIPGPPCATTEHGQAWTDTPPTSSPHSSPGQPDNRHPGSARPPPRPGRPES